MQAQVRASVAILVAFTVAMTVMVWHTHGLASGTIACAVGLAASGSFGWWSLRTGRHTPWSEAAERVADGHAVVLWKPGCMYCERLLHALRNDPRVTGVNVWKDPQANALVRQLNEGNEYTPTVLIGQNVLRNPTAAAVAASLDRVRPLPQARMARRSR